MNEIRKKLIDDLTLVIHLVIESDFVKNIEEIFLLGSLLTDKEFPNDLDLILIINYNNIDVSNYKFQQNIKKAIVERIDSEISLNFSPSIDSIKFMDGTPLESYLRVYELNKNISFMKWFNIDGSFKINLVSVFGYIDTPCFKNIRYGEILDISIENQESIPIKLDGFKLPRKAIWNFLKKRMNTKLPTNHIELIHPPEWKICQRSGRCCQSFNEIRDRFKPEIPNLFDVISQEYNGMLWNCINISSEADLYWLVEKGLNKYNYKLIQKINKSYINIPCPFLKTNDIYPESECMIWSYKPDACTRFPEFTSDIENYNCNNPA